MLPLHLRGRTMGVVSIIIAVAPAVGPTAGGTSLYITVMTLATTLGVRLGQDLATAEMTGIHNALRYGAVLLVVTVVLVPFVRTPKPQS
ncbi:hypothetical protein [Auritidibacter ignavus]|uniref:hypothetical protein n=1 Tax=Auritidibacter ignavus TaxID=678932 RepID=UPI0015D5CC01|nr:hypothetical protein [Auritidibacter ignavus]